MRLDISIFARRLSIIFAQSGLSEADFGARVNRSRKAVISWLYGRHFPDVYALAYIGREFGVSIDWLLGLDGVRNG